VDSRSGTSPSDTHKSERIDWRENRYASRAGTSEPERPEEVQMLEMRRDGSHIGDLHSPGTEKGRADRFGP